jgi:hypothetical protein
MLHVFLLLLTTAFRMLAHLPSSRGVIADAARSDKIVSNKTSANVRMRCVVTSRRFEVDTGQLKSQYVRS